MPADLNKVLPSHLRMEIEPLLRYPVKAYTIKCCYTKREATLSITFDMLHTKKKWETAYGDAQDVSSGPATTHASQKDVKDVFRDEDTETGTEAKILTTDSETSDQSDSRRTNVQRKTVIQEHPQEWNTHGVGEITEQLWKIVDRKFNRRKRSKKRCRNNRIKTYHPQPSTQPNQIHSQPSKCPDQTDSHLCPGVDVSDTPLSTCPNVSDNERSPVPDVPHKEPTQGHGISELQPSQHPEVTCNEPSQDLDLTRSGNIEQNKVRSFNGDQHMKHIYQPISNSGVLDAQDALTPATKVQANQPRQHSDVPANQPRQHSDVPDNQPSQHSDVPDNQPSQHPDMTDNQPSQHSDVPDNQPSQHSDVPDSQPGQHSDVSDNQPSQHPDMTDNAQPGQHPDVPDNQPSQHPDVSDNQPSQHPDVPDNQPGQHPDVPDNQPSQHPDVPDNQPSQHPDVPDNQPSHHPDPQRRCTKKLDNKGSLKRKSHEMNVIKESDEKEDTEKCGWSPGEYLNSPKYRQVARRHLSDHSPHHIQGYDRISLSPHYPVFTMVIQTGSHIKYSRIPTAKDLAAFFSIWRRKYNFNEGFVSQASLRFLLSTDTRFNRAEQPLLYQLLRGRVPFMNKRSKLDFLDKY